MKKFQDISLLQYNTFGIDVRSRSLICYESEDELIDLIRNSKEELQQPILNMGAGSNLLFLKDFRGTILKSMIEDVSVLEEDECKVRVRVGSGWIMDEFIVYSLQQGWYGLENLSDIPGLVGASAVQNIGAYGVEIGERIEAVNCISLEDGTKRTFCQEECCYSYRHSIFKTPEYRGRYAVTSVDYCLDKIFTPNIEYAGIRQGLSSDGLDITGLSAMQLRNTIINIRKNKLPDPKVQGNAGSFFMNPIVDSATFGHLKSMYADMPGYVVDDTHMKIPAAWLIEQCGWKGAALGRAGVHLRQPLVLVNLGGATGNDIKLLSDRIQQDVLGKFGVKITPEVNFI
jgi:UDP-N-acetylmuramate dehydrogenase